MLGNEAGGAKRGGMKEPSEPSAGLEDMVRQAINEFGPRAVGEAFAKLQSERQEAAADEARQAIIDLTASGQVLTLAAEREIIERTGVDRRTYQGVLNGLIWRRKENEGGILDFKGSGFGVRVDSKEIAEKFRKEREVHQESTPEAPDVASKTEAALIADLDRAGAVLFVLADVQQAGTTRYEHLYARALQAGINRFAIPDAIRALLGSGVISVGSIALGVPSGDITTTREQVQLSPREQAQRFLGDVFVGEIALTYQQLLGLATQNGIERFYLGEELDSMIRRGEITREEPFGVGKLSRS